ncbi:MAG TPA: hypothetical protein VKI20_04015, partial [Acidimicrobiales bacterium]|nr:hypothetical protein [Acidimicrobiales bacterium]
MFAHLDELTPKLREALATHEDQVRSNAKATPLVRDVPISADVEDLRMGGWDTEEVRRLFGFLEFRTLWDRLVEAVGEAGGGFGAEEGAASGVLDVEVVHARSAKAAAAVLDEMRSAGTALALEAAWSGQPGRSRLTGLALVPAAAAGSPEAAAPEEALTAHWLDVELLSDQQV